MQSKHFLALIMLISLFSCRTREITRVKVTGTTYFDTIIHVNVVDTAAAVYAPKIDYDSVYVVANKTSEARVQVTREGKLKLKIEPLNKPVMAKVKVPKVTVSERIEEVQVKKNYSLAIILTTILLTIIYILLKNGKHKDSYTNITFRNDDIHSPDRG